MGCPSLCLRLELLVRRQVAFQACSKVLVTYEVVGLAAILCGCRILSPAPCRRVCSGRIGGVHARHGGPRGRGAVPRPPGVSQACL